VVSVRAEERHGRHHDATGLQNGEPRREHGVGVRSAQKRAIAGDEPVFVNEEARDSSAEIVEVGVGPAAMLVHHRKRLPVAALQQFRGGVEALGILKLGQVEAEFRKQLRRR